MEKTKKKRRGPGRPPVSAELRRDRRLDDVRFSASELAFLRDLAAKSGFRWSDYVRRKLGITA